MFWNYKCQHHHSLCLCHILVCGLQIHHVNISVSMCSRPLVSPRVSLSSNRKSSCAHRHVQTGGWRGTISITPSLLRLLCHTDIGSPITWINRQHIEWRACEDTGSGWWQQHSLDGLLEDAWRVRSGNVTYPAKPSLLHGSSLDASSPTPTGLSWSMSSSIGVSNMESKLLIQPERRRNSRGKLSITRTCSSSCSKMCSQKPSSRLRLIGASVWIRCRKRKQFVWGHFECPCKSCLNTPLLFLFLLTVSPCQLVVGAVLVCLHVASTSISSQRKSHRSQTRKVQFIPCHSPSFLQGSWSQDPTVQCTRTNTRTQTGEEERAATSVPLGRLAECRQSSAHQSWFFCIQALLIISNAFAHPRSLSTIL